MVTHPGQKLKLRVAHASREFHPSEDLSELPLPGQEYQRWCCHRKTDRPRSAFWTVGPAPHLICRFHADRPAQVDLRAPSNVAAHSLSLQGTPADVFPLLDMHFTRYMTKGQPLSVLSRFQKSSDKVFAKTSQIITKHYRPRQRFYTPVLHDLARLSDSIKVRIMINLDH